MAYTLNVGVFKLADYLANHPNAVKVDNGLYITPRNASGYRYAMEMSLTVGGEATGDQGYLLAFDNGAARAFLRERGYIVNRNGDVSGGSLDTHFQGGR